jgi:hypothetical protein
MNKRVLIVDDEVAITEGLMALFECEELAKCGGVGPGHGRRVLEEESFP